jgi:TRAP-type transport system periplasmic protein
MMKKLILSVAALGVLVVGAVAAGMSSSTTAVTTWDMPTPYPEATFHTVNIKRFAEEVRQATAGRLVIQVHSAGSLFKHPEIKNAVRAAQVHIGEFLLSQLPNQNALFEVDAMPFLATDYDQAARLWEISRPHVKELLGQEGLMTLYSVPWPPQGLYADQPVRRIDDLRGRKFRAYNTATERLAQLAGAVPTQVEVPDIAQAFATGRVQAMITSPSTGVDSKAWDFVRHYYHTQAWLPKNIVVVNQRSFAALDSATRAAVLKAARAAEQRGWQMSRSETEAKLRALRENGMAVEDPSPELMSGLREVGRQIAAEWVAQTGAAGTAILEAMASRPPTS